MRFLVAAVVTVICSVVVYAFDRLTAARAERAGAPVGYHPLTLNHRRPRAWQWAVGAIALFFVAFGAAGALGIG